MNTDSLEVEQTDGVMFARVPQDFIKSRGLMTAQKGNKLGVKRRQCALYYVTALAVYRQGFIFSKWKGTE